MGELLHGVRVVKMLAWEPAFIKRIGGARARELKQLAVSCVRACVCACVSMQRGGWVAPQ